MKLHHYYVFFYFYFFFLMAVVANVDGTYFSCKETNYGNENNGNENNENSLDIHSNESYKNSVNDNNFTFSNESINGSEINFDTLSNISYKDSINDNDYTLGTYEEKTYFEELIDAINAHNEQDNFFFDYSNIICAKKGDNRANFKPYIPITRKCSCHTPPNILPLITTTIIDEKFKIRNSKFKKFKERIIMIYAQKGTTWNEKIKNYVYNWCEITIDNLRNQSFWDLEKNLLKSSEIGDILGKRKQTNEHDSSNTKKVVTSPLLSTIDTSNFILWRFSIFGKGDTKFIGINNGIDMSIYEQDNYLLLLEKDNSKYSITSYNFNLEKQKDIIPIDVAIPTAIDLYNNSLYVALQFSNGNVLNNYIYQTVYPPTNQVMWTRSLAYKFSGVKKILYFRSSIVYIACDNEIFAISCTNNICLGMLYLSCVDIAISSDNILYILTSTALHQCDVSTGEIKLYSTLVNDLNCAKSLIYVKIENNAHIIITECGNNRLIDISLNNYSQKHIPFYNHMPLKLYSYDNNIFCISQRDYTKEIYSTEKIAESISADFFFSSSTELLQNINSIMDIDFNELDLAPIFEFEETLFNICKFVLCHPFKSYKSYTQIINKIPDIISFLNNENIKSKISNSVQLIELLSLFIKEDSKEIKFTSKMKLTDENNFIGKIGFIYEKNNGNHQTLTNKSITTGILTNQSYCTSNHQQINEDSLLVCIWGYCLVAVHKINEKDIKSNYSYYVVMDSSTKKNGIGKIVTFNELSEGYIIVGKCTDIKNKSYWNISQLPNELKDNLPKTIDQEVMYTEIEVVHMQEDDVHNYLQALEIFSPQCFNMSEDAPIQCIRSQHPITLDNYDFTDIRRTAIKLHSQEITGNISFQIFSLKNLRKLDLSCNKLTGIIPNSINNLSNLQELILSNNELEGEIPFTENLTNLTILNLNNNKLSGTIPECIGSLNKLRILNLSNNQLTGTIPESIGNIGKLEYLYLQNNNLSGPIPSFTKLEIIAEIDLCNNDLELNLTNDLIGNVNAIINLDGNTKITTANIPEPILEIIQNNKNKTRDPKPKIKKEESNKPPNSDS